jgi:peptidoglycan/xylan/chitin deacetylase (PgdA/CDA1 family)
LSDLRVALTFDAEHPDRPWCPPANAQRILGELERAEVPATFFVQGRWAKAHPDTARRVADDGIRTDLEDGAAAVEEATGRDPRPWFRCPFGAGHDDERVLGVITELGYRNVHWDVEVEDWEPWRAGPAIAKDVVAGVRTHGDGAVVLLHTWPGGTGDAVAEMVAGLRGLGATFVTVDALDRVP